MWTKKNAHTPRSVKAFREERRRIWVELTVQIAASIAGSVATVLAVMHYWPK